MAAGNALYSAGRSDLAVREFRAHLADRPDDASAHVLLAASLLQLRNADEAIDEAREAVRLAPQRGDAHAVLADALGRLDRTAEAIAEAREAVRLEPHEPSRFSMLAHNLTQSGRPREALAVAEQGLALNPRSTSCLNQRGLALIGLRRVSEAREAIRSALVTAPDSATLHNNLGLGLLHEGKMQEARAEFREALRLAPTSELYQRNLKASSGGSNVASARMTRARAWWSRLPVQLKIAAIGGFAVGSYFWLGFIVGLSVLLALTVIGTVNRWSWARPGRRRSFSNIVRPLNQTLLRVAALAPVFAALFLNHYEWGMGAGLALVVLLGMAIAEPSGFFHWLAIAAAVIVGAVGVFARTLHVQPDTLMLLGFSWLLLYIPDLSSASAPVRATVRTHIGR